MKLLRLKPLWKALVHSHLHLAGCLYDRIRIEQDVRTGVELQWKPVRLAGRVVVSCTAVWLELEDVGADDVLETESLRLAHVECELSAVLNEEKREKLCPDSMFKHISAITSTTMPCRVSERAADKLYSNHTLSSL